MLAVLMTPGESPTGSPFDVIYEADIRAAFEGTDKTRLDGQHFIQEDDFCPGILAGSWVVEYGADESEIVCDSLGEYLRLSPTAKRTAQLIVVQGYVVKSGRQRCTAVVEGERLRRIR